MIEIYDHIPSEPIVDKQKKYDSYSSYYKKYHRDIVRFMKYGEPMRQFYQPGRRPIFLPTQTEVNTITKFYNVLVRNFITEDVIAAIREHNYINVNSSIYFALNCFISEDQLLRSYEVLFYKNTCAGYYRLELEDDSNWTRSLKPNIALDDPCIDKSLQTLSRFFYNASHIAPTRDMAHFNISFEFWDLERSVVRYDVKTAMWTGVYNMFEQAVLMVLREIRDHIFEGHYPTRSRPLVTYYHPDGDLVTYMEELLQIPMEHLYVKSMRLTFNYNVHRSYLRRMLYLPVPAFGGCAALDSMRPALKKRIQKFIKSNTPLNDTTNSCFFYEVFKEKAIEKKLEYGFDLYDVTPLDRALEILKDLEFSTCLIDFSKFEPQCHFSKEQAPLLTLLLVNNHYYTVDTNHIGDILKYRKCDTCYNYYNFRTETNLKHIEGKCSKKRKRADDELTWSYLKKSDSKQEWDDIYFADFETFKNDDEGNFVVYAAGLVSLKNENVHLFIGEDALGNMLDYLSGKNCLVYFYNGSNFDFHFIVDHYIENDIEITSIVYRGRQIMTMKSKQVEFKDLYLFTLCSLRKACEDFGVPEDYWKKEFDHSKVNSYEDVEKFKSEIETYLTYDVLSLKHVFKNFKESFEEINGVDITQCLTLSHAAFTAWYSDVNIPLALPSITCDSMIRRSYYGGRVFPQKIIYETSQPDANYDGLNDYFVDIDFVSLYPTAMCKHKYFYGNPKLVEDPVELKRIVGDLNTNWKNIVCVDVECPDIYTPILPERLSDGKVYYNLKPKKKQVYVAKELDFAVRMGYSIVNVYWALTFPSEGFIFKDFILKNMKIKNSSKKGTPRYTISKITMNATYGKFAQRRFVSNKTVHSTVVKDMTDVLDIKMIKKKNGEFGCIVERLANNRNPTKPVYIASQITAYSRLICNEVLDHIKAIRVPSQSFIYSDTDSFVIPYSAYKIAEEKGYIGKDLGQLDDELDGGKITKAIMLAPKTYIMEYITPENKTLWKVRCKGIPHVGHPILKDNYDITDEEEKEILTSNDVSKRVYYLKDTFGNPIVKSRFITYDMFKSLVTNPSLYIECKFSSFRKTINLNMKNKNEENKSGIQFTRNFRSIRGLSWWHENNIREMPSELYGYCKPKK